VTAESRVELASSGHQVLFDHAVLWGAAAIARDVLGGVRLGWTGGLSPAPVLTGVTLGELATAAHDRAVQATLDSHWMQADLPHEPGRALFSPRVKALPPSAWPAWQQRRLEHRDRLVSIEERLDLRLMAALGEPSSWHEYKGQARQDDAASRLELQPRNQGSEFVGTRLRALAAAVAARTVDEVADGLTGASSHDEVGKDGPDSRSASNLRPPGATDSALAWAAMWGLASTAVAQDVGRQSRTSGHLPWSRDAEMGDEVRGGHVVAPMWRGWWSLAKLQAVLCSAALSEVASAARTSSVPASRAKGWLVEQGVVGLVLMPVHTFGSTSAPERRVMPGSDVRLVEASS